VVFFLPARAAPLPPDRDAMKALRSFVLSTTNTGRARAGARAGGSVLSQAGAAAGQRNREGEPSAQSTEGRVKTWGLCYQRPSGIAYNKSGSVVCSQGWSLESGKTIANEIDAITHLNHRRRYNRKGGVCCAKDRKDGQQRFPDTNRELLSSGPRRTTGARRPISAVPLSPEERLLSPKCKGGSYTRRPDRPKPQDTHLGKGAKGGGTRHEPRPRLFPPASPR
jgi:hypothetical protein